VSQRRGAPQLSCAAIFLFRPCYFPCSALLIWAGFRGFALFLAGFMSRPAPLTGIYRTVALKCTPLLRHENYSSVGITRRYGCPRT